MKYSVRHCTCSKDCPHWFVIGPDKALVLLTQKQARAVAELLRAMDEQTAQEQGVEAEPWWPAVDELL